MTPTRFPEPTIMQGSALGLAIHLTNPWPARQVHCIVTSPPYYGLRDYGTSPEIWDGDPACQHDWSTFTRKGQSGGTKSAKVRTKGTENFQIVPDSQQATCTKCGAWRGELGQEPTPQLFVKHLVDIFNALKPLLHDSGTLWVNLGDSYAGNRSYQVPSTKGGPKHGAGQAGQSANKVPAGMKSKDIIGIPWMFAFAMREAGWYFRADIIWHKPNPMPESVTDRPTKSHEYLFLFAKSEQYYYDAEAVKEPPIWANDRRAGQGRHTYNGKRQGAKGQGQEAFVSIDPAGRNRRSVWTIPTAPYKGAHFATYPPALVEPCIQAGTSEKGVCAACGAPWERVVEQGELVGRTRGDGLGYVLPKSSNPDNDGHSGQKNTDAYKPNFHRERITTGWRPTCSCADPRDPVPAIVLDPFCGSGTTLQVARSLGREGWGFELNPKYIAIARERLLLPPGLESVAEEEGVDLSDLPFFTELK